MDDPYKQFLNKMPGDKCVNDYECASRKCRKLTKLSGGEKYDLGFRCKGVSREGECEKDADCDIGLYCDSDEGKCLY